jgi:endonuclease-3
MGPQMRLEQQPARAFGSIVHGFRIDAETSFGKDEMKRAQIAEMFARLQARDPDPKTELAYSSPFTLLVAVVLSAQATDAGVNRATPALFAAADTPEKMIALGEGGIRDKIKTIGLFNTKAKNVWALSKILVEQHGGEVPRDREALEALPGVGRKTANVVLNVAFGEATIAVDTHIFRVSNRTGLAPGKTPDAVEAKLMKVVPAKYRLHAHHWLILHGRYICQARKPLCPNCIIRDLCGFKDKTKGIGDALGLQEEAAAVTAD